jgi:hypothetical protein
MAIETLPFVSYPDGGRKLLGRVKGDTCRHGYGLQFQQITRQHSCAYCGMSLIDTFEHWMQMCLDHVIPVSCAKVLKLDGDLYDDITNKVLACAGCNTFGNRYVPKFDIPEVGRDEEAFFDLRDKIFVERKSQILDRRNLEMTAYNKALWKNGVSPGGTS